jgi:hypothetical protein
MAHPIAGEPSSAIATERVAKYVACRVGYVTSEGDYGCGDIDTAYWGYYVDLRNDGTEGCRFQLDGGGV